MKPLVVMIKPASGQCNMKCDYCFYGDEMEHRDQASFGFMTEETLKAVIRKTMLRAEGGIYYVFQGGEPTLRGLPFFHRVMELQRQYNKKGVMVYNSIQTNGYLLDDAWCHFFAENRFLVGISLDGVKRTHDACRHGKEGSPSFDRILGAIRLLEKCGAEYNILTVVTKQVAESIGEIYTFYKKQGFRFQQYIACMDPIAGQKSDYSLTPAIYGEFLIRLFRLWADDFARREHPFIRQFENDLQKVLGFIPEACEHNGRCSEQYAVEADGSVYPCDFYMLDEYRLGNFNRDNLTVMQEKRKELCFIEESERISDDCRKCSYYSLCRNGCRRNRIDDRNRFCESYYCYYDACLPQMHSIADQIKQQR